jgi:hypothetical protein
MNGYLMVHCGSCGATNKVYSLREQTMCVTCKLSISKIETPSVGCLLGHVDVRPLRVPGDKVSSQQGVNDLSHVLSSERVEVAE